MPKTSPVRDKRTSDFIYWRWHTGVHQPCWIGHWLFSHIIFDLVDYFFYFSDRAYRASRQPKYQNVSLWILINIESDNLIMNWTVLQIIILPLGTPNLITRINGQIPKIKSIHMDNHMFIPITWGLKIEVVILFNLRRVKLSWQMLLHK